MLDAFHHLKRGDYSHRRDLCKIEIRIRRSRLLVPDLRSKDFARAIFFSWQRENALFFRECPLRSAIICLRGRGIINFAGNRVARSYPGPGAYTCAYEGSMQNVSSRYRLKHKFLKRCDTRTPRHNLTNGARRGERRVDSRRETGQICANRAISSQIYGPVKIGRRDTRHTMNRQRRSSATRARIRLHLDPGFLIAKIGSCHDYRFTVSGEVVNRIV